MPYLYVDTFDTLNEGGFVSETECQRLLRDSRVAAPHREKIWSIVSGSGEVSRLGRNEFNVFLALIGLDPHYSGNLGLAPSHSWNP